MYAARPGVSTRRSYTAATIGAFGQEDLKGKVIRGGFSRLCAQGATFVLRAGSLMILARLLSPNDFGLVGMVTAFTGMLSWLRDFGLSAATVQHTSITEEQLSTLFWVNIVFGAVLGVVTLAMSPAIAAFYDEPRLLGITAVLAASFLFNAAGTQHSAILQRQMHFTVLALINVLALTVGAAIAILGANAGYGYWALVAMAVIPPIIATGGFWLSSGWVPGTPRRRAGIRSMIHFGSGFTLTGLLGYLGYNAEKIMIGRFWGADAIGIYGRGYQITSIPVDSLHSAFAEVAFAALSRLRDDSVRIRSYFLKGFSLNLSLTLPVAIVCLLFADDVVFVLLGPKWAVVTDILRLLAPTTVIFAIINPLGWLVFSQGLVKRGLQVALVRATLMVSGCAIALPYGPNAVAFAYSAVLVLWIIPHIWWCVHGTAVSVRDVLLTASGPLGSGILAGGLGYGARLMCGDFFSPFPRLVVESGVLGIVFFGVLLFVAGQKSLYLDLLRGIRAPSSAT
jgi:PST family polysaccharide transporter